MVVYSPALWITRAAFLHFLTPFADDRAAVPFNDSEIVASRFRDSRSPLVYEVVFESPGAAEKALGNSLGVGFLAAAIANTRWRCPGWRWIPPSSFRENRSSSI